MGSKRIIKKGDIYTSNNYGEFKIVSELSPNKDRRRFLIEFLRTGTKKESSIREILNGEIKDPYFPKIFDIGYLGNSHKRHNERLYNIWLNILARCYNSKCKEYKYYGEKGITVDKRWHCFEYFLNDVQYLDGFEFFNNPNYKVELDKDILQSNKLFKDKIYSKDTCIWVKKIVNNKVQIEQTNKNKNLSSKYIGVCLTKDNTWQAQITINGKQTYIGRFINEDASANAYNYFAKIHNTHFIENNCVFMTKDEWMSYKVSKKDFKRKRNNLMTDVLNIEGLDQFEIENTPVDQLNYEVIDLNSVGLDESGSMGKFVQVMRDCLAKWKKGLIDSKESDKMLVARGSFRNHTIEIGGYKKIDEFDENNYSASGGTPMYDYIIEGAEKLLKVMEYYQNQGYKPRAVFSIFSDGEDQCSSNSLVDAKRVIEDLNKKEIVTAFIAFGQEAKAEAKRLGFKNIEDAGSDEHTLRNAFDRFSKSLVANSKSLVQKTDNLFDI